MPDPATPEPVTYSEYLHVADLLEHQVPLTKPPVHDEMQFIVVHQVYELWFRLLLHEMDEILRLVAAGSDADLRGATRLCRRIQRIMDVLIKQIHVLESMRPADFLLFRRLLNPASGFQSVQFREFECVLGLKDTTMAGYAEGDPRSDILQRRLGEPSLSDLMYVVLKNRGLDIVAPGPDRTDAEAHSTLQALKAVYDSPDDHPLLYDLCEAAVEIDEQVILWRRHHVMMVERQIGDKRGTGATNTGALDGIRYLQTTLSRRAFPDLWNVRTLLED